MMTSAMKLAGFYKNRSAEKIRMIASTKDHIPGRGFFVPMQRSTLTPFSYFDLLEACALPGCPVCRLEVGVVTNYLDGMLYENVNDPETQASLRKSTGLCREHAWRLTEISSSPALGIAILYRPVAREIADELQRNQPEPRASSVDRAGGAFKDYRSSASSERIIRSLKPQAPCPACVHKDKMVDFALNALLEALNHKDERMLPALQKSDGLCRPHLIRALSLAQGKISFLVLQRLAREKLN